MRFVNDVIRLIEIGVLLSVLASTVLAVIYIELRLKIESGKEK